MNRRYFLFSLAAGSLLRGATRSAARITRIRLTPIQGRFHKFVTMNAYDKAPKGHTYEHTLIRIETDQGIEGVGAGTYATPDAAYVEALRSLIGTNPLGLYVMEGSRIVGRSPAFAPVLGQYKHLDGPLFDLIGKLTSKPVWQLIGDSARDRVEAYDGTLYFSDLWFRDRGVGAVVEEVEEALRSGYSAVKLKLGRGFKWMEKNAGLQRDIAVVRAVRQAAGMGPRIMGDPNDGYRGDFDGAWRLLSETREAHLHWIEEIFPENVEQYTRLKARLAEAGMKTLIADGENFREAKSFEPYLKPRRLIDVLQMDIRQGGFLENLEMARMGEAAGAISIPHNWASQIGLFMGLHLSKAVKAVPAAEDDRSTCDVIIASGYEFEKGSYAVSSEPGLGIRVDPKVYDAKYKARERVIS